MTRSIRPRLALALAPVLLVALSACGGTGATPVSQSDAEKAACAAIQTWSDESRALDAMDPNSATLAQVQAQSDKVQQAWKSVQDKLTAVNTADKQAVLNAAASFEANIGTFPSGMTVAAAKAQIQAAAAPLKATYMEMANGLGCTIVTPY